MKKMHPNQDVAEDMEEDQINTLDSGKMKMLMLEEN